MQDQVDLKQNFRYGMETKDIERPKGSGGH